MIAVDFSISTALVALTIIMAYLGATPSILKTIHLVQFWYNLVFASAAVAVPQ
jgi:hypothetical protein